MHQHIEKEETKTFEFYLSRNILTFGYVACIGGSYLGIIIDSKLFGGAADIMIDTSLKKSIP